MLYRTTLAPLFTLRREMDRMLGEVARPDADLDVAWIPNADLREEASSYVFELDLPGVTPDAVTVTSEEGLLSVHGTKGTAGPDRSADDPTARHLVLERPAGTFQRKFRLPKDAVEDRIDATFTGGVLSVRVPKAEAPKPRKIEVRTR